MKILFLTIVNIDSIYERNIYTDLMRKFRDEGHEVFICTPAERRLNRPTRIKLQDKISVLSVKTLNIQKTNLIEKGLATLLIEHQYLNAIKKHYSGVRFDLVLYSTPPITFSQVINYIKKRDDAKSYLLLKDIFPQNAVDLGLIKANGLIYRFFRQKERKLYLFSDVIGCMSPANVEYVLKHNPQIPVDKLEVCPNSISLVEEVQFEDQIQERKKYHIPENATIFIYGGNLGKPQGVDFLLEVLESNKDKSDRFFVIVGSGTEFYRIDNWFKQTRPENAILLNGLPKVQYDRLIRMCQVGLIFLAPQFTIPNYPSRLLSYLENKMPVVMATDVNTDIGPIAEENRFGFWTPSGNLEKFNLNLERLIQEKELISQMGKNGYDFLIKNYTVENSYQIIMRHFS